MATLLIEHSISDFDTWHEAFTRFAGQRAEGGVVSERIMQPVDDTHFVFVELDFTTTEAAQRFKGFLETRVWSDRASSPALDGTPLARVASPVCPSPPPAS
jgi:hypothetical protein